MLVIALSGIKSIKKLWPPYF